MFFIAGLTAEDVMGLQQQLQEALQEVTSNHIVEFIINCSEV
jgi:hypothetical protein